MKYINAFMALACVVGALICLASPLWSEPEPETLTMMLLCFLAAVIFFAFYIVEVRNDEIRKLKQFIHESTNQMG